MIFRNSFLGVLLLLSAAAFGQVCLKCSKGEVVNNIYKNLSKSYTAICGDTTVYGQDTFKMLKVELTGPARLYINYFFDKHAGFCDSIEMYYYCSSCAEKSVKGFLSQKSEKWKRLDTDLYISGWHWKEKRDGGVYFTGSKLFIKRTPNEPICTYVRASLIMLPKKEWKKKMNKFQKI